MEELINLIKKASYFIDLMGDVHIIENFQALKIAEAITKNYELIKK